MVRIGWPSLPNRAMYKEPGLQPLSRMHVCHSLTLSFASDARSSISALRSGRCSCCAGSAPWPLLLPAVIVSRKTRTREGPIKTGRCCVCSCVAHACPCCPCCPYVLPCCPCTPLRVHTRLQFVKWRCGLLQAKIEWISVFKQLR